MDIQTITRADTKTISAKLVIGCVAIHHGEYGEYWGLTHVPTGFALPVDGRGSRVLRKMADARTMAGFWAAQLPACGEYGVSPTPRLIRAIRLLRRSERSQSSTISKRCSGKHLCSLLFAHKQLWA